MDEQAMIDAVCERLGYYSGQRSNGTIRNILRAYRSIMRENRGEVVKRILACIEKEDGFLPGNLRRVDRSVGAAFDTLFKDNSNE